MMLAVQDLRVAFAGVDVVTDVSFSVDRGEVLAVVGESGAGKSLTALAVPRLLPAGALLTGGSVRFRGEELTSAPVRRLRELRGRRIGVVFQDPLSALNPVLRIGAQIDEALRLHDRTLSRSARRLRVASLLDLVEVPDARRYPHQLSGGLRQRALLAMALANSPDLLIADEPTAALDPAGREHVLRVLAEARASYGCAVLLVTHDLDAVASIADSAVVMYAGRVVEAGSARALLASPRHPYTRALVACREASGPRLPFIPGVPADPLAGTPGCAFQPRCAESAGDPLCTASSPALRSGVACHHREPS